MQQNIYFCVLKSNIKLTNMKKITILSAILLFSVIGMQAQKVTVSETRVRTVSEKITKGLHPGLPDLYYSFLNMTKGSFGPEANVPLRPSSFEWGMYSPVTIFCTGGGHFGMATGLGISNSYNFFDHSKVLVMNDGNSEFQQLYDYSSIEGNGPVTNLAHRSFLRYWSLRLPLTMQLQWNIDGNWVTISAGAEIEWRFGVRSFAKYGGSKHTISNDLDYNPLGVNALVSLGFDDTVIFARMGLTEMFKSDKLNDIYQFAFGFGFNFD